MRGRKPKTLEQHKAAGNPGKRRLPEPVAVKPGIEFPEKLSLDKRTEYWFAKLVAAIPEVRLAAEDSFFIVEAAAALSIIEECVSQRAKHGLFDEIEMRKTKRCPACLGSGAPRGANGILCPACRGTGVVVEVLVKRKPGSWLAVEERAWHRLHRALAEVGLGPSERARVGRALAESGQSEFELFLAKRLGAGA